MFASIFGIRYSAPASIPRWARRIRRARPRRLLMYARRSVTRCRANRSCSRLPAVMAIPAPCRFHGRRRNTIIDLLKPIEYDLDLSRKYMSRPATPTDFHASRNGIRRRSCQKPSGKCAWACRCAASATTPPPGDIPMCRRRRHAALRALSAQRADRRARQVRHDLLCRRHRHPRKRRTPRGSLCPLRLRDRRNGTDDPAAGAGRSDRSASAW